MEKHPATNSRSSIAAVRETIQQRILPLVEVVVGLRDGLRELVMSSGMQVLEKLLEDGRQQMCGPAKKKQSDRQAYRYGHDKGQLVMGGRKVSLAKPRVRSVEGEEP